MLVLLGAGLAIGLFACALAAGLLGMGIISSSFIVALQSKSPSRGIFAFLLQCGIFTGIPAGAVCAWLFQTIFSGSYAVSSMIVAGALSGALAGVLVAVMLNFVVARFFQYVSSRAGDRRIDATFPSE